MIKLFTGVINCALEKAKAFVIVSHFHDSLIFTVNIGAYLSGSPQGTLLLGLPITAVKGFIVQAP